MPYRILGVVVLLWSQAGATAGAAVDLGGYDAACGIEVRAEGPLLVVTWPGERDRQLRARINLEAPDRLLRDLSVWHAAAFHPVVEHAEPKYSCYEGRRRGGWDNFFDAPARHRDEIRTAESSLSLAGCRVTSHPGRVTVALAGLSVGSFHGELAYTFFRGSNLILQEALVETDEPDVAYCFDAWLANCSTKNLKSLGWLNSEDRLARHVLRSDQDLDQQQLRVNRRTIVAEGPRGSLALLPAPHQFFFARDETVNLRHAWYRLYRIRDEDDLFAFGIRQHPLSSWSRWSPLYNGPPGRAHRWKLFLYVTPDGLQDALQQVSAYTHDDKFKPLPGYRTFTTHYHLGVAVAALAHGGKPYSPGALGMPVDSGGRKPGEPEFKQVMKDLGVEIMHLHDMHISGHPRSPGQLRLRELSALFSECRRLSDDDFLLLPGEEGVTILGGHWSLLFPRPVYFFWVRADEQPFEETIEPFGTVYRVAGADEMHRLIAEEGALVWQTHPRTKGSTGFPDKIRQRDYYQDDRWLGAAFKAMPSDLSSPRLGERALRLADDMNNWGGRKMLVGEVDVFKLDHTHELYGHMNVNYLKLDRLPRFDEGWQDVVDALSKGRFFVTTGEVLIRDFRLGGAAGGATLAPADEGTFSLRVELEWTFPLERAELVSGDGQKVYRHRIDLADTGPFGGRAIEQEVDLPGRKWARFEVWDVAANGAFTQPVWIERR